MLKKYFSVFASYLLTCVLALCMLRLIWLISSGDIYSDTGRPPVYFTENGNILSFFGEPLYISRDTVEGIANYPLRCASFCLELLPSSLTVPVQSFAKSVQSCGKEFVIFTASALKSLFTLGLGI